MEELLMMVVCRTDIYMFVIDGQSKEIITEKTYHQLDYDFILEERLNHTVIGITVQTCFFTETLLHVF